MGIDRKDCERLILIDKKGLFPSANHCVNDFLSGEEHIEFTGYKHRVQDQKARGLILRVKRPERRSGLMSGVGLAAH